MPYILQTRRAAIDTAIEALDAHNLDAGDLNYAVTRLALGSIKRQGGLRYIRLATVIGTLVCCILEIYRRVAAGYEDKAIVRNGDVKEIEGLNNE